MNNTIYKHERQHLIKNIPVTMVYSSLPVVIQKQYHAFHHSYEHIGDRDKSEIA